MYEYTVNFIFQTQIQLPHFVYAIGISVDIFWCWVKHYVVLIKLRADQEFG